MRYPRTLLVPALMLAGGCGDATGPGQDGSRTERFDWSGQIATGTTVEIRNIQGDVSARPGSGATVRVRAVKEGREDSPATVRIEVVETPQGVTVCAVYPDVPGLPPNQCLPGGAGQLSSRGNDVSVRFEVEVPPRRAFVGATIAGSVEATALDGYVDARTVTGDIHIATTGVAEATTISGDIEVSIGQRTWDRDLSFHAVNGDVRVWLPLQTNADVWGSTGRGSITTDFPLQITQVGTARQLQGRLGSGGRNLHLATVAGNVALRALGPPAGRSGSGARLEAW